MVAESCGRAEEEHGCGQACGHDHGVVSCAGGQTAGGEAGGSDGLREQFGEFLIHGDRGLIHEQVHFAGQEAAGGDGLGEGEEEFGGLGADGVMGTADVEGDEGAGGNDVGRVGSDLDAADGSNELVCGAGGLFDGGDPLGGGGESVAAESHGGGTGVICVAVEDEFPAALANDGGDNANGEAFGFEDRALLNVELEETHGVVGDLGVGNANWVEAEVADGLGEGDAGCIGELQHRGVESSGYGAAAEEWAVEAHALFFAEGDDLDGVGTGQALGEGDEFQGEDDTQDPVKGTSVRDGIDVRTEDEAAGGAGSWLPEATEVADGVSRDGHAEVGHAATEMSVDVGDGRGEEAASCSAGFLGHGCDEAALVDEGFGELDAISGDGHGVGLSSRPEGGEKGWPSA